MPVGSFKKTPLGEVCPNVAFKGLKFDQAGSLDSYMHLRPCRQQDKIDCSDREEDILTHDFLDSAACEKPAQNWCIKRDEVNPSVVVLRNKLYPGYFAYTRANAAIFGGVYIGTGLKNTSLPFMI